MLFVVAVSLAGTGEVYGKKGTSRDEECGEVEGDVKKKRKREKEKKRNGAKGQKTEIVGAGTIFFFFNPRYEM